MTRLSREEIYRLVWASPMTVIAKTYQISDVGFRKLCLRMHIPVPRRGHWAKIAAGMVVKQPKLPGRAKGPDHAELKERPPEKPVKIVSELKALIKVMIKEKLPFRVPDRLKDPDPWVTKAKDRLGKMTSPRFPGMRLTGKDQLDIRVTAANVNRALRFMDTLIKCVRARGYTYVVEADVNYVLIRNVRIFVKFRELTAKVRSKANPYVDFEWQPTGEVVFRMECRQRAEWGDRKKSSLEEQLPHILAKLELAAKAEEAYLVSARLEREHMERQRRVQAEREQRQREELKAFKALLQQAQRWKKSQILREYIAATAGEDHERTNWAIRKADWYDPLTNAPDEWLTGVDPDTL